jgi:hypothetical protein
MFAYRLWLWAIHNEDRYHRQELAYGCLDLVDLLSPECIARPSCCKEILDKARLYQAATIPGNKEPDADAFDRLSTAVTMHAAGHKFGIITSGHDLCEDDDPTSQVDPSQTSISIETVIGVPHEMPRKADPHVYVALKTIVPMGVPFDRETVQDGILKLVVRALKVGRGDEDAENPFETGGNDDFVAP